MYYTTSSIYWRRQFQLAVTTFISVQTNTWRYLYLTYYITLRRDNLPAVDVKTWYLHAHMFDGDIAAGPVPLLFAANPDEAAASIAAEPAKAHFDLSKVTFIILISLLFSITQ